MYNSSKVVPFELSKCRVILAGEDPRCAIEDDLGLTAGVITWWIEVTHPAGKRVAFGLGSLRAAEMLAKTRTQADEIRFLIDLYKFMNREGRRRV